MTALASERSNRLCRLDPGLDLVLADLVARPPTGPAPDPAALMRALVAGANDTFSHLLLAGYQPGALEMLLADPVSRAKTLVWLLPTTQIPHLLHDLDRLGWPEIDLALIRFHDPLELPPILERLPLAWGLVMLDPVLLPPADLLRVGQNRWRRRDLGLERSLRDLQRTLAHLPRLEQAIPLTAWKDAFAGRTAICLAAGPSLKRHLEIVRAHQDRCVIIAVDVIQAGMVKAGVRLDFVINVHPDPITSDRLAPGADPQTVAVACLGAEAEFLDAFALHSFFGHGHLGLRLLGAPTGFSTGTTVGIASIGFAGYLGCREVLLAGHDLAFEGQQYYTEHTNNFERLQSVGDRYAKRARLVQGNSGQPVVTDTAFEIALHDLTMMLATWERPVYNLNLGLGLGARIPHTQALPANWRPAGDQPCPRPSAQVGPGRLGPMPDRTQLRSEALAQAAKCRRIWSSVDRSDPRVFATVDLLQQASEAGLAAELLAPLLRGLQIHRARMDSLPPSLHAASFRRECQDLADRIMEQAETLVGAWFEPEARLADPGAPWSEVPGFARFLAAVQAGVAPAHSPSDGLLLPTMAGCLANVRRALPDLPLPTPRCADEGLLLLRYLGPLCDRQHLEQTLCLCQIEDCPAPLTWAREAGLAQALALPGDPAADLAAGPVCRQATAALRLLNDHGRSDAAALARIAAAWPPARVPLVRALAAGPPSWWPVLEQTLRSGQVEVDDQVCSLIVLHVRDFAVAQQVLKSFTTHIGEATTLAFAHRCEESGDLERALRLASGFRPLSRFRDDAASVACAVLIKLQRPAEGRQRADTILDMPLRRRWQVLTTAPVQGLTACLPLLAGAPPDLAAELARIALARQDADGLQALASLAAQTAQTDPSWRELAASLQTIVNRRSRRNP